MSLPTYYSLRSYASYIATFKWRFFAVFLFFAVANVILAVIPFFIGQLVAALAAQPPDHNVVYFYVAVLVGCSIGHDVMWRGAELLFIKLLNAKSYEYENAVFHQVIHKKYPYFVGKFTGKIGSYVGNLGREFRDFLNEIFYSYIDLFVKLPTIAVIMFTVNIYTGVVFVASFILMLIVGRLTMPRSSASEQALTSVKSDMDGYVIDVISNFVSVKAFKKEQTEFDAIVNRRKQVTTTADKAFFWAVVFWGSLSLVVRYVIWPVTIVLNVHLYLQGVINLAQITTFFTAIVVFSDYIWEVIWHVSQFNLRLARMEESYQYLFGKHNIMRRFQAMQKQVSRLPDIHFNQVLMLHNLVFAYPDRPDSPVLNGINLTIKKGEKVGIVGKSGSGKTTLVKLLLGYYKVGSEMVLLDGVSCDNRHLVHMISYVPQDTGLFHRSIKDNIAYGTSSSHNDADIVTAAKRAHAHEFIEQAPEGYDTEVGERGIKLSMGQRQRIAIARAFLDNKPILVLDEATSALDSESEALVQRALEDLWHNKTVIAIAHRLSTLLHMDRIVVMSEGRIVEDGTHDELLQKRGHYYRLWQHQSGSVIADE